MANSILSALIGKNPFQITSEASGYTYWADLAVVRVDVLLDSEVTDQPMATKDLMDAEVYVDLLDVDVTNGKILRPSKLRLKCLCANLSTVEDLMNAFADTEATFQVSSKSIIIGDMMMVNMTITQSDEILSAVEIEIDWEQAAPPDPTTFAPADPADATNISTRVQNLKTSVAGAASGFVTDFTSGVTSLYNKVSTGIRGVL